MIRNFMRSRMNSILNGSWEITQSRILLRRSLDLVGGSVSVSVSPLSSADSVGWRFLDPFCFSKRLDD